MSENRRDQVAEDLAGAIVPDEGWQIVVRWPDDGEPDPERKPGDRHIVLTWDDAEIGDDADPA